MLNLQPATTPHSPFRGTSRLHVPCLPEREAAGRVKYTNIVPSDWSEGEETDVGGPSSLSDWSEGWSDDSETEGFHSNSQSEASWAFITVSVLNRLYEGRDGVRCVVRRSLSHTGVSSVLNVPSVLFYNFKVNL